MNKSDGRLKILLSEGSSNSARQTLYGLGRNYRIDLVDPSPWCQCRFSSLVRRWVRSPCMAKDPLGYGRFVADLLQHQPYDVLFPTHEQAYLLAKFRDAFSPYVGLALPAFEAMRRVQSKVEFRQLLAELDLPTPESCTGRCEGELQSQAQFPCYAKLAHSTASLGVVRVRDKRELHKAIRRFETAGLWSEGTDLLLQQPARGRQAEVSGVFQHGRLVAVECADVIATGIGGGPSFRVSASHPVVVEHLRRLGTHLQWHGPIVLDYFYDTSTGQPQYIEANPRIGEAFNAQASGVNLCETVVQVSLGRHVDELPQGKLGVHTHNGFVVLLADAYNGANRRQLFHRLWQSWFRKGPYNSCESEMTRPREDWGSLIPATAVSLRLLAFPHSARKLAKSTIDNYSLPQAAANLIDSVPAGALDNLL